MKRFFAFVLVLCLGMTLLPLAADAQTRGKLTLTGETEHLSRGDRFAVYLEWTRNPGVSSLLVTLRYDPKVLEVASVSDLSLFPSFSHTDNKEKGSLVLRWKAGENDGDLTATGQSTKLIFRVLDEAPLGGTQITPEINEKLLDATNRAGQAVPFDLAPLSVPLECLHVNCRIEVREEATFSKAGSGEKICPDCGERFEATLLPTILSADGTLSAQVQPGEYAEEDGKDLRVEFLHGGEEVLLAKELFGDTLIRTFRIRLYKNGNVYYPQGESHMDMKTDFSVPSDFAMYILVDGSAQKLTAEKTEDTLSFPYSSYVIALVSREAKLPQEPADVPQTPSLLPDEEPKEEETVSSRTPEEAAVRREGIYLMLGISALILFGAGAIFVLRKGKSDRL